MPLTLSRANRILEKILWSDEMHRAFPPQVRHANRGEGQGWVIDRFKGQYQVQHTDATLDAALARLMEHYFPFDTSQLTAKELDELRAIKSPCSHLL